MKLYISGPMSGKPEHNFPAFREAAKQLTAAGYDVIDPSENFGGETGRPRPEYMRKDIEHVLNADGIALLPGWQQSAGAKLEVAIARELGLEATDADLWVKYPEVEARKREGQGRVLNAGGRGYSAKVWWVASDAASSGIEDVVLFTDTKPLFPTDTPPAQPETILQEAQRLVHGDRGAAYGHPAEDFGRTAEYWTTTFKGKLKPGESFEAADVPLALIGVKLSREVNKPKRDNMTDLAGYAETRRMVLEREGRG